MAARSPAVWCWALALVGVCALAAGAPARRNMYVLYSQAGRWWAAGQDCYLPDGKPFETSCFRYAPVVAVAFSVPALLPDGIGGALWRMVMTGTFAAGFYLATKRLCDSETLRSAIVRNVMWLLALLFCLNNMRNGQSNLLVIGTILIAAATFESQHWMVSAACFAAAIAFKIYPVSVLLLFVAMNPVRLAIPAVVSLGVAVILPFATSSPEFVLTEYRNWFSVLGGDDRLAWGVAHGYRDVSMLVRLFGVPVSRPTFFVIQVVSGLIAAAACVGLTVEGKMPRPRRIRFALCCGIFWMLLFGPATEAATLVLIAPVVAWAWSDMAHDWQQRRRVRPFLTAGMVILVVSVLGGVSPTATHAMNDHGAQPLGTLFLAIGFFAGEFAYWRKLRGKGNVRTSSLLEQVPELATEGGAR
jgi:hypothetical protein